jgi:hypothetical protein
VSDAICLICRSSNNTSSRRRLPRGQALPFSIRGVAGDVNVAHAIDDNFAVDPQEAVHSVGIFYVGCFEMPVGEL